MIPCNHSGLQQCGFLTDQITFFLTPCLHHVIVTIKISRFLEERREEKEKNVKVFIFLYFFLSTNLKLKSCNRLQGMGRSICGT